VERYGKIELGIWGGGVPFPRKNNCFFCV